MDKRVEEAAALVLRVVDFGEADRVVTLLTRELGVVGALARAARKSKRRFAGALEGFAVTAVQLKPGRGALSHLESARVTRVFPKLLANLSALEAAGALLRMARDILPERAPEPELFDTLVEAFEQLDQGAAARPLQLCCEARMLALTGFAPMLHACVSCGREPKLGQSALLSVARGGIVCRACGGAPERIGGPLRQALQEALEGAPLTALTGLSEADVREGERLLSLLVGQLLQREHKQDKRL